MDPSYVLTLSILLVSTAKLSLQQTCRSSSDLGQTECVLFRDYSAYQWATCLTEDYIKLVHVNSRARCTGGTAVTQCWYQCMFEIYNRDEGVVYSSCRCTPGESPPNNVNVLPAGCYSPRGDDCGWYANCLERRYPCSGTDDGYAIEYARKFCNAYSVNYYDFNSTARLWINRVRQCLQVALVPSLRLWVSTTCADISRRAFASHSRCYTSGYPSICQLSCADVWRAFVITNFPGESREGTSVTAPLVTIDQMLAVMRRCSKTYGEQSGCITNLLATIRISVQVPIIYRTTTTAYIIARHFARALAWERNGIRWFPLFRNQSYYSFTDLEMNFRVLLVDTKLLNIRSLPTFGQNLDQAIDSLVNRARSGSLSTRIMVNDQVTSSLSSVGQCLDVDCTSTNMTIVIVPDSECGTAEILHLHYLALYTAFAAVLLIM